MAELGLAANILGCAGFGAKVSISLYQFASAVSSARSEIIEVGKEISLFCAVLKQVTLVVSDNGPIHFSKDALGTLEAVVSRCKEIFEEMDGMVRNLQGDRAKHGYLSLSPHLSAKLRWTFLRSKVQVKRGTLDSMKLTLHLMLATLNLSQTIHAPRGSVHHPIDVNAENCEEQAVVESLVIAQQASVEDLERLEEIDERLTPKNDQRDGLSLANASIGTHRPSGSEGKKKASVWLSEVASEFSPSKAGSMASFTFASEIQEQTFILTDKWTSSGRNYSFGDPTAIDPSHLATRARALGLMQIPEEVNVSMSRHSPSVSTGQPTMDEGTEVMIRQWQEEMEVLKQNSSKASSHQTLVDPVDNYIEILDEDHFEKMCQQLFQRTQAWVVRFSELSGTLACRMSEELDDEKIKYRLDDAMLDGSNVDVLLADRVRRRDVFLAVTVSLMWEFIFTRYLFGLQRRQKRSLTALENSLPKTAPGRIRSLWRTITLSQISKNKTFELGFRQDVEAAGKQILSILSSLLPPPPHFRSQILVSLLELVTFAAELSVNMRTQRKEYILCPHQPDYDPTSGLISHLHFDATIMMASGRYDESSEALEWREAVVEMVLFPFVIAIGDELGEGAQDFVIYPAQVLISS